MPLESIFDIADKTAHLTELDERSSSPSFWENSSHAQQIMQEAARLREEIDEWVMLTRVYTRICWPNMRR
jgi:hypothetical protein